MADIKDLIRAAIGELEKKKDELKEELQKGNDLNRALLSLESKAQELEENLETLVNLPLPIDLIDFYVKNTGRVWVSKLRGSRDGQNVTIQHGNRFLTWSDYNNGIPIEFGAYRFILLIIKEQVPTGVDQGWGPDQWEDGYGDPFPRKKTDII